MSIFEHIQQIEKKIQEHNTLELSFRNFDEQKSQKDLIDSIIYSQIQNLDEKSKSRILNEFQGWGPVAELLDDTSITEIIINGPKALWFEKNGKLFHHPDCFSSQNSYENFISRVCQQAQVHFTLDRPMVDGKIFDFRLHLLSEELTKTSSVLCLRRHPQNPWTLESLVEIGWSGQHQLQLLKELLAKRENFLVIGSTGSGKTSVLNACLQSLPNNERVVIIEDTSELRAPNSASTKLLTRRDANNSLSEVNQTELLRQSLRMRPDRIVMGEIRGPEAKDLLMALSTGHAGSFATLHANDPQQALLRLEMLIQLGAPFWSIEAIRNLIFLSLQKIIVVGKNPSGGRELKGIYTLSSREESGILVERTS